MMTKFGGHKQAAGLTIERDRIRELRARVNDYADTCLGPDDLRPRLWIECGECSVGKLHKLAVKVPDAEIWVIKRNPADAEHLLRSMEKEELRHGHYRLLSLDPEMFAEVLGLLRGRNEMLWVAGEFDPPEMRFDFNGLWFEAPFSVREY